jgi:hypothetical protein
MPECQAAACPGLAEGRVGLRGVGAGIARVCGHLDPGAARRINLQEVAALATRSPGGSAAAESKCRPATRMGCRGKWQDVRSVAGAEETGEEAS